MDLKSILWYGVLISITGAYLTALGGVRSAIHHDVPHHSRRMILACTIVGIWLVAYVSKQVFVRSRRIWGDGGSILGTVRAVVDHPYSSGHDDAWPWVLQSLYRAHSSPDGDRSGRHGKWGLPASIPRHDSHLDLFRNDGDGLWRLRHVVCVVLREC